MLFVATARATTTLDLRRLSQITSFFPTKDFFSNLHRTHFWRLTKDVLSHFATTAMGTRTANLEQSY